ncbi:MAG: rhodanese-like domain-containing protein [Chloroflexota bacterium]
MAHEISAQELKAWLEEKSLLLLDVREVEERAGGFIPGSLHIPMRQVPFELHRLEKDRPVVVYCAHGIRSASVADFLERQGYQATSLQDGIYGWLESRGAIHYKP